MFKSTTEMVLAARVARLFYFARQSKVQIATSLDITRFEVARLLELARTAGIVKISVNEPGALDLALSEQLRAKFGLDHAVVVRTGGASSEQTRAQIGQAAADLLCEISTVDDVIGLSWARAVLDMATHLDGLKAQRVVQVTGALTRSDVNSSAPEVVRNVAIKAGAEYSIFYAPLLVSDVDTAKGLYRQKQVVSTTAHYRSVTKAIVGVGGWDPPHSTLHDAMSPDERVMALHDGVKADLSGVLIDAEGGAVQSSLSERIVAISAAQLKEVPMVIALAYGVGKVPAARAALAGGYLQGLVTHTDFALGLLAAP